MQYIQLMLLAMPQIRYMFMDLNIFGICYLICLVCFGLILSELNFNCPATVWLGPAQPRFGGPKRNKNSI
ncbi:hypothetical protein HanIR_Chr01g0040511 [Helianthus annuus]|nr:hypothetical protein HanIR_Chr01g0040511 [Helianthus annuus]